MTDKQDTGKHPFLSAVLGAVQPMNILKEYFRCFRGYQKTKAYILSWLDNWIYLKLKQGKTPWVYVVCQDLADDIGCCRDTVQRNLKELCSLGILKRLPFKRWATDHIWQYTIDCESLELHLFSSFTRAISNRGALGVLWIRLLSDTRNQTAECQKSDSRMSEIRQPDVESSTEYANASLSLLKPTAINDCRRKEKENEQEIKDAIATAPFMLDEETRDEETRDEETRDEGQLGDLGVAYSREWGEEASSLHLDHQIRFFLRRLRLLRIPTTKTVENWVKKTPQSQLASNILALEELASEKGLKNPLAAFFAAVKDNWQPKNDKQTWWTAAAAALGRYERDKLIRHIIEIDGVLTVCFSNRKMLPFDEAKALDWDVLAMFGGES